MSEHVIGEAEIAKQAAREEVHQKISLALEQADRGELFDGDEVFRDLLETLPRANPIRSR
jgi:predicted transcriptional regulator